MRLLSCKNFDFHLMSRQTTSLSLNQNVIEEYTCFGRVSLLSNSPASLSSSFLPLIWQSLMMCLVGGGCFTWLSLYQQQRTLLCTSPGLYSAVVTITFRELVTATVRPLTLPLLAATDFDWQPLNGSIILRYDSVLMMCLLAQGF